MDIQPQTLRVNALTFTFVLGVAGFFAKYEFDRITTSLQGIAVKQEITERAISEMRIEIKYSQQTIEKVTEVKPRT